MITQVKDKTLTKDINILFDHKINRDYSTNYR